MTTNFDSVFGDAVGWGEPLTREEVKALLAEQTEVTQGHIASAFADAGWYDGRRDPYEPPRTPVDAPVKPPPAVEAERRLWLVRYNPASSDFVNSDIADDSVFPWQAPHMAPVDGWWLDSTNRPKNRTAISEITSGDLVICQRTHPGTPGDPFETVDLLVGICAVAMVDSWEDAISGRREYRACLLPLAKFKYPVPRGTARRHGRLTGDSFAKGCQLPGRHGGIGFGLSVVEWGDAIDLLSVCGIPPQALSETNTAILGARLRASDTGNELFLRLRYDAVLRDSVRRAHERAGLARARAWASNRLLVERTEINWQQVKLAGFDLLFEDRSRRKLQVEVKGYASPRLSDVTLQPSQERRAREAARGLPPDWRLFALLDAGKKNPRDSIHRPAEVTSLIDSGGIKVRS